MCDEEKEGCLCPCDIDEVFRKKKVKYKKECGDFYVGQLNEIKGDYNDKTFNE